jgi:hypothetical protein
MLGQKLLLKRLHIVLLVLGGSCTDTAAWTGRDTRKCKGTTTQLCSKQSLRFLEKGWIGTVIATSTLSFGLLFPAFADEPPIMLQDADQTYISSVQDDRRLERTLEPAKNAIDGKSLDAASSEGSHISESSDNELTRTASMPESATNGGYIPGEGMSEDNIILAEVGSATMEERDPVPVEQGETSQSPVGTNANDDHFHEDPLSQNAEEGSSPSLAYIDEIAKSTSEVLAEVDTISSTKQDSPSSDEDDVWKHVAATDENEMKVSNKERERERERERE